MICKSYLKGTIQGFEFVRGGGGGQDKHNEDKSNGYQPQRQQNNNYDDDSSLPFWYVTITTADDFTKL